MIFHLSATTILATCFSFAAATNSQSFLRASDSRRELEGAQCLEAGPYWAAGTLSPPFTETQAATCVTYTSNPSKLGCTAKDGDNLEVKGAYAAIGGEQCYFCGSPGTIRTGQLQIGIQNDTGSTRPTAGILGKLKGVLPSNQDCNIARCNDNSGGALPPGQIVFNGGNLEFACGANLHFDAGGFVLFWADASSTSKCPSFNKCDTFDPKCKRSDVTVNVGTGITCKNLPSRSSNCGLPPAYTDPTAVFNVPPNNACGSLTMTSSVTQDPCTAAGKQVTRTYTLNASPPNKPAVIATCSETVTMIDAPPTLPASISGLGNLALQCASEVPDAVNAQANDDCDGSLVVTHVENTDAGSCFNDFVVTRTYSATDSCGQTTTKVQVITVEDTEPPVINNCPSNLGQLCDDTINLSVQPSSITDNCDVNVDVCFTSENSIEADGTLKVTRTWTANDHCNEPVTCVQEISVGECTDGSCGGD